MEKLVKSAYGGEPRNIIPLMYNFFNTISGNATDVVNRFDLRLDSMAFGLDTYKFTYFIGDILTETGFLGAFLFTGVSYYIFRKTLIIRKHCVSLSRLMIAFSWYMVILVGVFYFYYGQLVGNVFLLFPFIVFVFYNLKQNKTNFTLAGSYQKPIPLSGSALSRRKT